MPRTGNDSKLLGGIICGSHPEFHLFKAIQLAFAILSHKIGGKDIINKLAQSVRVRQIGSDGVGSIAVIHV